MFMRIDGVFEEVGRSEKDVTGKCDKRRRNMPLLKKPMEFIDALFDGCAGIEIAKLCMVPSCESWNTRCMIR